MTGLRLSRGSRILRVSRAIPGLVPLPVSCMSVCDTPEMDFQRLLVGGLQLGSGRGGPCQKLPLALA